MDGQLSERKPRDQNEANNNEMEYLKSIRKSLEQQDKGGLNYLSLRISCPFFRSVITMLQLPAKCPNALQW